MRRKSGILIIFSLFILCAFVALAKNNETEQEGELNGAGLTGTYRAAADRQGPLGASCSTAVWHDSWDNTMNLTASASISNSDPDNEGSYTIRAKVLGHIASFADQYRGACYDSRGKGVGGSSSKTWTIDDAEAYAVIYGSGPKAEAKIPW